MFNLNILTLNENIKSERVKFNVDYLKKMVNCS